MRERRPTGRAQAPPFSCFWTRRGNSEAFVKNPTQEDGSRHPPRRAGQGRAPFSIPSPPRKRGSRAAARCEFLDSRLRGNDEKGKAPHNNSSPPRKRGSRQRHNVHFWIPASAGMTNKKERLTHSSPPRPSSGSGAGVQKKTDWMPAFAGMTVGKRESAETKPPGDRSGRPSSSGRVCRSR